MSVQPPSSSQDPSFTTHPQTVPDQEAQSERSDLYGDTTRDPANDPVAKLLASTRTPARSQGIASWLALGLIVTGVLVAVWALFNIPIGRNRHASAGGQVVIAAEALPTVAVAPTAAALLGDADLTLLSSQPGADLSKSAAPTATPASRPVGMTIGLPVSAPLHFLRAVGNVVLPDGSSVAVGKTVRERPVFFDWKSRDGQPASTTTFAAAERFDTIFPGTSFADLKASWKGDVTTYTVISVLTPTIPALEQILGAKGPSVQGQLTMTDVVAAAWNDNETTLAIVPFDQLTPELVVLPIDGQNPVENAVKFDPVQYPLLATMYAHITTDDRTERAQVDALLTALPEGNRNPNELTTLTMTGVTAMVRMMADEMDRRGAAWPAEYVGEELSSADITHISNEVPWVDDCETDLRMDNFNFCTKTEYIETLRLSGTDIIGLTGNHQNDFGRRAAYHSLDIYEQEGWPVYGGGRTLDEAKAPLFIEHNGNRLAFLGANSYGPEMAWAEGDYPGSAPFNLAILSQQIRDIKANDQADLVLVELQYQESYGTEPLIDQRNDFNALIRAGADIVTGVQSHVPQAMEFTDGKLILYGLGNLYFDQMFQQNTRENMIVKHTLYQGRHISTQVMTTLLYDFGQPRFMSDDERASLLTRIFGASYWDY